MMPLSFEPDCSQCAGLCCAAYFFDKGDDFPEDKPAGVPCQHLCDDGRCGIHSTRTAQGYRGCIPYTCHGAGQRVVQEFFAGRSWHDDSALLIPMVEALRGLSRVHEKLMLLEAAAGLPLTKEQTVERSGLAQELLEIKSPQAASGFTESALERRISVFLSTLRAAAKAGGLSQS